MLKNNYKIGMALALLGILTGLLTFYLMADIYNPTIAGKFADGRPDEALTVRVVFPFLGWLGISAGALWGAILYGFAQRQDWAWFWGVVAATIQLLAGFFPAIPAMDSHLPTPTLIVFGCLELGDGGHPINKSQHVGQPSDKDEPQ